MVATWQQYNIARLWGTLARAVEEPYKSVVRSQFHVWLNTQSPQDKQSELSDLFDELRSAFDWSSVNVPANRVRVCDLKPGDKVQHGSFGTYTVARIHFERDRTGERWKIFDNRGSVPLVHLDGNYTYLRHQEPPTRTVEVSNLVPGDELAGDEQLPRIVTKVIRQEITTTANQQATVRYSVHVNGDSRPAFDHLLPDFTFTVKTTS